MNKLTIFDTHCHLADKKYHHSNQHPKEIIQAAEKAGVKHILNVGYDKASNQKVIQQLTEFPSLFGALGLHPNTLAKKYDLPVLLHIRGEAEEKHIEVFNETYQIVKEEQIQKGILHCFTGN
ncbi:1301_t:CDS:2 [Funneliformis geosporum]|uniref:1301_t:CDS:1 n=1 Tax=Funneliformis geosporum TaxID=1117311 RepID=A0A9W4SAY0_9GLOM|nr:1301_t:CDS:2 [Funneliformis geosporum]